MVWDQDWANNLPTAHRGQGAVVMAMDTHRAYETPRLDTALDPRPLGIGDR